MPHKELFEYVCEQSKLCYLIHNTLPMLMKRNELKLVLVESVGAC